MKQRALHALRRAHLLGLADAVRCRWMIARGRHARERFAGSHSGVPLPPNRLAYDAYGSLDWDFYWGFGERAAQWVSGRLLERSADGRVLEWGCGPARIIRHLPDLLGRGWEVHGSDANTSTIAWCARSLPAIHFANNGAAPPLSYASGTFDAVYAVSVFTHLPGDLHRAWADELRRVLKPGGLLICTLHGDASRSLLLGSERVRFDSGSLVVRGAVAGGTRCFLAYHPPAYVTHDLLREFEIVEHHPAPNLFGERQDIWVARQKP